MILLIEKKTRLKESDHISFYHKINQEIDLNEVEWVKLSTKSCLFSSKSHAINFGNFEENNFLQKV